MRLFLVILIVVTAGAAAWLLLTPGSPISKWAAPPVSLEGESLALHGVHLFEKKHGSSVMELTAEKGVISLDETRTDLEKFTLVSHTEKMGDITLTARKGTMINATHDVTASGDVVARDGMGRALLTGSLEWVNAAREIKTDDTVRIFGDTFVITGKGLLANVDTERVEILSDVRAVFKASNE